MCDGQNGTVSEGSTDGALDQMIGLNINGSSRLIQHNDATITQKRASQADQLSTLLYRTAGEKIVPFQGSIPTFVQQKSFHQIRPPEN